MFAFYIEITASYNLLYDAWKHNRRTNFVQNGIRNRQRTVSLRLFFFSKYMCNYMKTLKKYNMAARLKIHQMLKCRE